jgi:predicted phage terminase large subunit-like protein
LIIDDPIKDRQEAESKTARKNVQNWYQAVAYTRVMPGGKIVVINTRWHSSDLSGYLMEEHAHENWAILDLKAIAEPGDILKRKEGEALWPEFRDLEQLEIIKTALGPREWNAQFQQRPTALGGGRVKFEWINHYEQLPKPDEIQRIVASWDTAYKPEQINDPTACTIWIITATGYYLIDVRNKRLEFPDLVKEVQLVHEIHHPSAHLIEGRATGQSLIQELKRSTRIPTVEISTKNINNEIRFDAITTLFESGKVWFPKQAHWLSEAEDQICSFPTAPHDDIADSVSQFLNWVNKPRYVPRPPSKLYWK